MHQLDPDLARVTILARLTTAKDARLARQVRLAAREARRDRRRATRRNPRAGADLRPARPVPPVDDLELILAALAERVAENGTRSEVRALTVVAVAASDRSPGATQALLDWRGAEIARLRAFGIVAGSVLKLDPGERQQLADGLLGGGPATTITGTDAVPAVQALRPSRSGRRRSVRRWAWWTGVRRTPPGARPEASPGPRAGQRGTSQERPWAATKQRTGASGFRAQRSGRRGNRSGPPR